MADTTAPTWRDVYWTAADGTRLHARDYPAGTEAGAATPIVCLPGLTRNARDFAELARRLSPHRRVIAANLRGRGGSEAAKDPATYAPETYVADTLAMLDALELSRVGFIGTSIGGLVAMMVAAAAPERVAGLALNDVGPRIEPAGLARLRGYAARLGVQPTWMHAARAVAELNRDAHPGWGLADWLAMAKRLYRINSAGRIVPDYDPRIADAARDAMAGESAPDLWPLLDAIVGLPVLVVRGELSDVLSAATAAAMATALPGAEVATVPRCGHAPALVEAEAVGAIERWLRGLDGEKTA